MLIKNTRYKWFSNYNCFQYKIYNTKVDSKITGTSSLVTTVFFNTRISEVENKIPDHAKNILLLEK